MRIKNEDGSSAQQEPTVTHRTCADGVCDRVATNIRGSVQLCAKHAAFRDIADVTQEMASAARSDSRDG